MNSPPASGDAPLLLVASSGGHLLQLTQLRRHLQPSRRCHWVTFDRADARSLLQDERVTFAHHPTNRNVPNLVRNLGLALRLVGRLRPSAVITTGAGVAVPFCLLGRLFGCRVIYIESFARTEGPSLTGRLVHPFVHHFFVQWPELLPFYRRARYVGTLFDLA